MLVYRCKVCGYLHVTEATENCPVCGAAKTLFEHYNVPDLAGTKTFKNLAAAFAGESQANRRYTLWQALAEIDGDEAAVEAFERPIQEETAHALSHAIYMGMYGTTSENLRTAAEGEAYEQDKMYPEFANVAEEEGYPEIAHYFRSLAKFEGVHKDGFLRAKKAIDTKK